METSAIDLKPQHKVENDLNSDHNIFCRSDPGSQNYTPFELKIDTPICDKNGAVSLQLQWQYVHYGTSRAIIAVAAVSADSIYCRIDPGMLIRLMSQDAAQ